MLGHRPPPGVLGEIIAAAVHRTLCQAVAPRGRVGAPPASLYADALGRHQLDAGMLADEAPRVRREGEAMPQRDVHEIVAPRGGAAGRRARAVAAEADR